MSKKNRRKDALLLHDLAVALNACGKAGLKPELKHGIIYTRAGYVVPFGRDDAWVARSLTRK